MRAIVCGSRDETNKLFVWKKLGELHRKRPLSMIITGAAPGVDRFADAWAVQAGIDRIICPANWIGRGNAAGPIRNGVMLWMEPNLVIAFPGGIGTADMVHQAGAAGVTVEFVER